MICKTCGKIAIFSNCCKECEQQKLKEYIKKHTFIYGEIVKVKDDFYEGGFYEAIIIDKDIDTEGTFGYYLTHTKYKVKSPQGKEIWYSRELIFKINDCVDPNI